MKVGFVGAGRMGRPMVDRLVAAGHDVRVLTRRPEARAAAEADGLTCADTVPETVRDAEVVISVLLDDGQVRTVLGGAVPAMRPGAVLVQHTTCDPATAMQLAETGAEHDIRVLDAAVSGNPRDTAAGQLTLWIGGDERAVDEVRPALEAYASPILHVGAVGDGQRIKLVNNALFVSQVGLAVEGARIAGALGIGEEQFFAAVAHGSGASRASSSVAWIGVDAVGHRLAELMLKDVVVVREIAERADVDLGLIGDVLSSHVVEQRVLRGGQLPDRSTIDRSRAEPGLMKGSR